MLLISVTLAVLGLVGGSFINALVWRLHEQTKKHANHLSIVQGRSMCPHCKHQLAAIDLVPVLSWLMLAGRCRYCKASISKQYPLVELATATAFVVSYLFWPTNLLTSPDVILFAGWLVCLIGLVALMLYDAKYFLLPNRIIYPTLVVAVSARSIYALEQPNTGRQLLIWGLAILVASGIFRVIYAISDKLIGFGDVRLGLITGTLLATPAKCFLMLFLASVFGLVYALPSVISKKRRLQSQVPFGPFLISASFVVMLFGQSLLDWYSRILPQ